MTKPTAAGVDEGQRNRRCVAFAGGRRIAHGDISDVASRVRAAIDGGETGAVLVFDERTSEPVEMDLRGSAEAVRRRMGAGQESVEPRGPGRPRLGVVAREVTLLPRHWEWLSAQPGGASVALRKLVETARRSPDPVAIKREALESAYRFMSTMAGNEKGFEEATRALFREDPTRFDRESASWPVDVREHALRLARRAFDVGSG